MLELRNPPTFINAICDSTTGFWTGWLTSSVFIAGGKVWTVLFDPKKRVSDLLGHIGTPSFRRQLAVSGAVYFMILHVFKEMEQILKIKKNSLFFQAYSILAQVTSLAAAILAGAFTTHSSYHVMLCVAGVITSAMILQKSLSLMNRS